MTSPILAWPLHDLQRVFPGDEAPVWTSKYLEKGWRVHGAGGEVISVQLAVRSTHQRLAELELEIEPMRAADGRQLELERLQRRWADYVPLPWLTHWPEGEQDIERPDQVPGWYADPLLRFADRPAPKGILGSPSTVALHLSFRIPRTAAAGEYRGMVRLRAKGETIVELPLTVVRWPFSLPERPTFHLTNWFRANYLALWHRCEPWSERHWQLIDHYAADMAAHRQDVIYTPHIFCDDYGHEPQPLVEPVRRRDGSLDFDLTRFERWVELFDLHGFALFELSHCLGWVSGEYGHGFRLHDESTGQTRVVIKPKPDDPLYREVLEAWLTRLQTWIDRRGMAGRFLIHVFDEPAEKVWPHYARYSRLLRTLAPSIARIDAIGDSRLLREVGAEIEIPVPLSPHLEDADGYFRERARGGGTVWWYTCLGPCAPYANRFVHQPLQRGRMLFWQAWAFRISGYLHWGYNYWNQAENLQGDQTNRIINPYLEHTAAFNIGDCFLVYPRKSWWETAGPESSLRQEAMLAGVQDNELLRLLETSVGRGSGAAVERGRALLDHVRGPFAGNLMHYSRGAEELLRLRVHIGNAIAEVF